MVYLLKGWVVNAYCRWFGIKTSWTPCLLACEGGSVWAVYFCRMSMDCSLLIAVEPSRRRLGENWIILVNRFGLIHSKIGGGSSNENHRQKMNGPIITKVIFTSIFNYSPWLGLGNISPLCENSWKIILLLLGQEKDNEGCHAVRGKHTWNCFWTQIKSDNFYVKWLEFDIK